MSNPIPFPEANKKLQPPVGMSLDDCSTLHIFTDGDRCISCWQLTSQEIETLVKNGGRVYLHVWYGPTQPPVFLSPDYPFTTETN